MPQRQNTDIVEGIMINAAASLIQFPYSLVVVPPLLHRIVTAKEEQSPTYNKEDALNREFRGWLLVVASFFGAMIVAVVWSQHTENIRFIDFTPLRVIIVSPS